MLFHIFVREPTTLHSSKMEYITLMIFCYRYKLRHEHHHTQKLFEYIPGFESEVDYCHKGFVLLSLQAQLSDIEVCWV